MSASLDRALSSDFASFVALAWRHAALPGATKYEPNWHLRAICRSLQSVSEGRQGDTVFNVPPGTGKSVISGVFWPAWVWTFDPSHRWFFASYDASLLHRDTACLQALLRSDWYVSRWGKRLKSENPGTGKFDIHGGGARYNTSIRGAGTGWHAHTLVIDDPNKAQDALKEAKTDLDFAWDVIDSVLSSRSIDSKRFVRVLIAQRISPQDCSQRALEQGWHHVCFPMEFIAGDADPLDERTEEGEPLFPGRFAPEFLEKLRRTSSWDAQYQQRPGSTTGPLFSADMFVASDEIPTDGLPAQSWDLTFKGKMSSDWIAGQYWVQKGDMYFLAAPPVFQRATFTESLAMVDRKIDEWPSRKVLIEDKANGPAVEDVLRGRWPGLIDLVNPEGDKTSRAASITPLFATGKIRLVAGPHVKRWATIWPSFPGGVKRDDEIDACSQYLRWAWKKTVPRDALSRLLAMR